VTDLDHTHDAPDGRHGWIWGCTAVATVSFGFPVAVGIAGGLAGLLVLVPPREHRRSVLLGMAAGAIVFGVVIPLLLPLTRGIFPHAEGDAVMLAILIIGTATGLVSGLTGRVVTLPGLRAFRLVFLELCVLTALFGGILLLPKLHFTGAADIGGRITFAVALVLLFLMLPASLGHFLGRGLRRLAGRTA
jgi:hypothetical protein